MTAANTLTYGTVEVAGFYEVSQRNGSPFLFWYSDDSSLERDELPPFTYWFKVGEKVGDGVGIQL